MLASRPRRRKKRPEKHQKPRSHSFMKRQWLGTCKLVPKTKPAGLNYGRSEECQHRRPYLVRLFTTQRRAPTNKSNARTFHFESFSFDFIEPTSDARLSWTTTSFSIIFNRLSLIFDFKAPQTDINTEHFAPNDSRVVSMFNGLSLYFINFFELVSQ